MQPPLQKKSDGRSDARSMLGAFVQRRLSILQMDRPLFAGVRQRPSRHARHVRFSNAQPEIVLLFSIKILSHFTIQHELCE